MKRKIIKIDDEKCNGCALCIPNCPEGAIQIIDNKARLVSDLFCDGLGACLGHCPQGAIEVEEREAEQYDERRVMENIVKMGKNVVKAHLTHLKEHNEMGLYNEAVNYLKEKNIDVQTDEPKKEEVHHAGCPGSRMMDFRAKKPQAAEENKNVNVQSEIGNWPIQLQLINPSAPYLKNADLLIAADCVPFTYANFHQRFLKGKILTIFCPKLDTTLEQYVEKLTQIFKNQDINSITLLHMEVPCCFGVESVVKEALQRSGKNIIMKEYTISLQGEII